MKRYLVFLLVLLLLSGCAARPAEPETTAAPSVQTTAAPPAEPADPPAEPEAVRVASLPAPPEGLFSEGDRCLALVRRGDRLRAEIYRLPDGGLLAERALEADAYDALLLPDGGAALWDCENSILYCYEDDLSACRYTWTKDALTWVCLRNDGYLYAMGQDGAAYRVRLRDGAETAIAVPEGSANGSLLTCEANRTLIERVDRDGTLSTLWLDWATGKTEPGAPPSEGFYMTEGGAWETVFSSELCCLRRYGADTVYLLDGGRGLWVQDSQDGAVLLNGTDALQVWLPEESALWTLPDGDHMDGALSADYVVFSDSRGIRCWPYRAQAAVTAGEVWTPARLEAQNAADAARIERESGLCIRYGQAALAFNDALELTGSLAEAVTEPLRIHLAMRMLKEVVADFPIFTQLLAPPYERLTLLLCGPIRAAERWAAPSSVGYTYYLESEIRVALDIDALSERAYFRRTLAHEMMHVMENRINALGAERGLGYFTYWGSFAPGDDAYFYAYCDEAGQEISDATYTALSGLPPEEVSFIDPYSRTFPSEDIARIFEYLADGPEGSNAYLFAAGRLREKALYLCAVIRACFPGCQDAGPLPWEAVLGEVPPFSDYEEAVRAYEPVPVG